MFLLVSLPLGYIVGRCFGGSLRNAASLRIKHAWLPLAAIVLQIALFNGTAFSSSMEPTVKAGLHILSYLPIVAFCFINRRIVGIPLIAAGMLLNLIAIAGNGGFMPTTYEALASAGLDPEGRRTEAGAYNNAAGPESRFLVLGDIFAIPEGLPLSNVFSIGDVVIALGGCVLTVYAMTKSSSHVQIVQDFIAPRPFKGIELKERLLRRR
ncbi:MAG: DUF5317 domain-containing protein [Candidatus Aquicultorales bacterium]